MESVEKENVTHVAKDGDEISSTELEQESCLKKKKKPRRVSFAEITSVHVFDRDEDYETPPDNKPNTVEERVRTLPGGSPRPSLKLLQDEDVDDHLQSTPTSGLQENESEQFVHEADTPGSMSDRGTPGEEGEFFGPVSLWHIAPGMSARSPVTDDITLDCTTFSLQFGKLMVPGKECANAMEEVKTPATEIEGRTPATEDFKTPVGGTRGPSQGNSMVLTKPKQPISRQLVCDDDTLGNVEGMEDMRMTEEKQFKFDFANMHPDLDSLLAQKISELKPTIGTLPAKNSKDAKLMLDEEVKQSGIEIASKNGKNTIGIFSAKTDEDTKLGPVKRATIEMLSTQNNKDTKLIPCGEMNLPTSEIASETNKNTSGTLLVNNNEDIKLTPDEVKHQQRELGLISPAQRIKLNSCADEVHGPSIDINTTTHYNDTKATLHTEIRQSSIESATAKQSNDTKVMSVDDSSFIQFEGEQKQKQKEMFWDAERGIERKDPVNVELRGSTFETMSGNNQNKGSSKIDLELMAKHSYGLIESSLEHDAYSSHANSENQGNSKGQNQKGSLLIQRMNDEGIGLKGTGKNLLSNKYEDSSVKQSGSVELQEICACYTPLKAIHSATKQPGSAKLQEMHAHFTSTKAEGSIVKQNLFSNKYEVSAVKQSGSAELQEIRTCHTPLKAVHSASKQSGSVKLKDICAQFTPTKVEGSVVKQSSSVELQEASACYTPLKAGDFVAKQSASGKLQEICAHFTPTTAEGSVVKQSGLVKLYAHSDTRAMTEEEASSLVVKQSSSVELQEVPACYTPLKADHFVAKQSGSGKLQEICAHFTTTKAEGSVAKQSGSVKLYAHSDTKKITEEEASSLVPLDMKTKIDHGNNMLFLSQREWSSTHENTTDSQRYQKHQISDCLTDHIPKELKIYQHPPVDNCLKTNEFLHDPEKTLSSPVFDGKGCHGKKRKSEEMEVHEKGNLIRTWNKSSICERKPVEPGFIDNEYVDCSNGLVHSIKKSSVERTHPALYVMATSPTKFSDAPVKFSQGEDLCPPLITKPSTLQECLSFLFLQRPQLCLLQDTLKQLQEDMGMIKNASNPQFQALDGKKHLELENKLILPNHQSLGYVKWLQKVLAYERSKLLLLQTKKDELMKKFQELHFGREEVDRLKCSYLQKQFASNTSGRPVMKARSGAEAEAYIQFLKAEIRKQVEKFSNKKLHMEGRLKGIERENQIAQEKVIKMEQELGILENKVQHMREFYCGFLKVESKTRKQDIAELLRNHVKERSQATVILEDMQLWKLKEMKSKLGENFIELSYSNIISQRFVFERDGRDANILACLSLNHEYIEKVFPFMNASAVFGLVLGSKQSCKIAGVENICQVIQETSFLHGTLIDVLEEVQSCRSRLLNLSFTHFDCINGCGLQLQLKFINDRTGLEARLVLDMSNLLRGVYPSDAFPLEVKILQDTRQPKSMLVVEEVDKEIRVLQTGYPRIKNLCDRVSRLIEKNR